MKLSSRLQSQLTLYRSTNGGVFSTAELRALLGTAHEKSLQRAIRSLLEVGALIRFCRGLYVMPDCDLAMVSQRLAPDSYISCGSVLAPALLIGATPKRTIYAVKRGYSRTYRSSMGAVVHFGLGQRTRDLFFGFRSTASGICYADYEKAFLDTLYFYQSGYKFSFHVADDIDVSRLDTARIGKYLRSYKNPRFVQFVKGTLAYGND